MHFLRTRFDKPHKLFIHNCSQVTIMILQAKMKVAKKLIAAFLLPYFVHANPITPPIAQTHQQDQVPFNNTALLPETNQHPTSVLNLDNPIFSIAQIGKDIDGEDYYGRSGASLSLSTDGKLLAVGAYGYGGHVLTYAFDDIAETWTQHGQKIISEAGGDQLGTSMSLSHDGMTIAIGKYLVAIE